MLRQSEDQHRDHHQGQGHREGEQHVARIDQRGRVPHAQMRRDQTRARRCDLRGHDRQQPHAGHALQGVVLSREHQVGHEKADDDRQQGVKSPQVARQQCCDLPPARHTESDQSIDDRGQPHRHRPQEHALNRVM